jgi:hypothetical protein
MAGIRIGELLVEQGVLSEQQVRHVLRVQKTSGRPFGDLAERLYGIDPSAVEDAWVEQYVRTAGVIDLSLEEVDPECLRLLSARQAWQFNILPLHRRRHHLHMVTTADQLVRAVNFATRSFLEPVIFRLSGPKQLRRFLMIHYPVPPHIAHYALKLTVPG